MEEVLSQTIDYARERCHALSKEIENLEQKIYPTASPKTLLLFIKEGNEIIRSNLDKIKKDTELYETLTSEELEQKVKRFCKFLPYLCNLLEYIEGSEVQNTPAALIRPLKRLVRHYLLNSEIIFRSYSQLNYSFAPLTERLRKVFSGEIFKSLLEGLPEFFAVVSFPKVESNYVLLHCMVGHEIGHGLYQEKNLGEVLIPLVTIDKSALDQIAKVIIETESQGQDVSGKQQLSETELGESLRVKELLTKLINKVIGNWVEELAADAFGICIFGPAYFFAFINFVSAIQLLRSSSYTHPSPSIRMKLMWHLLKSDQKDSADSLSFERIFEDKTKDFVQQWVKVASKEGPPLHPIYDIVEKSITPIIICHICSKVIEGMNGSEYTIQKYQKNISTLCDLIKNLIPPNEMVDFKQKKTTSSDVVSILNAGWEVYLSFMDEFSKNFEVVYKDNKIECDKKLNELLLKAIELSEIKTRWDEIKND